LRSKLEKEPTQGTKSWLQKGIRKRKDDQLWKEPNGLEKGETAFGRKPFPSKKRDRRKEVCLLEKETKRSKWGERQKSEDETQT